MSDNNAQTLAAWDTSIPTLIISIGAGVLVPPASIDLYLGTFYRPVAAAIEPVLLVAFILAVVTVISSWRKKPRSVGFYGILSLVTINVAVLLSWVFGSREMALVMAIISVSTIPFAVLMAWRETVWRRSDRKLAVES